MRDLFGSWRLADRAAMAAIRFTVEKSILALDGRGEPPSSEETAAAKHLRSRGDLLCLDAMAQMDRPGRPRAVTAPLT